MALTEEQIEQIREELVYCKKPLIFFHDDPDGLASFLLIYRFIGAGKGVIVKTNPRIDSRFIKKVEEYKPDKIFILDIAIVEQEFIDVVHAPVVWIDHHRPLQRENVLYFNPRKENPADNLPVSFICYEVVRRDIWIGAVGAIGDWFFPSFALDFAEQYPELLPLTTENADEALFKTELGKLVKIFSFILNGTPAEAIKAVKVMTRIQSPYEILKQETPAGKFIFKKYEKMEKIYSRLLGRALKKKVVDGMFTFIYSGDTSFTKDLANEILYRTKAEVIIIGRENGNEIKMSIRATGRTIPAVLEKALIGIEGYGGGHEYACGACVKKKDYAQFIENLKESFELNKAAKKD